MFAPTEPGPLRYVPTFRLRFGGAEANFAIGLARLGFSAGWISRLGDDELGQMVFHGLRGEGIDVSRVAFDPHAPTALYVKQQSAGGDTSVFYYRRGSAASRMGADDVDPNYVRSARWVHVTGITPALSPSCRAAVQRVVDLARTAGVPVSIDPNLRLKLWTAEQARRTLLPLFEQCNLLLGGDEELALLLKTATPEHSADWAQRKGLDCVVKLGSRGALVATRGCREIVPPYSVPRVVDTVGAGDGFDAGFVAGQLMGRDPIESARLGNAVAAHALMVSGDFEGYPTLSQAEAFMRGQSEVKR